MEVDLVARYVGYVRHPGTVLNGPAVRSCTQVIHTGSARGTMVALPKWFYVAMQVCTSRAPAPRAWLLAGGTRDAACAI
jgi:hypothetical protein